MCGINAIYRYTHISDCDERAIRNMNNEMVYRGPDDEGLWTNRQVALGMRRLSIIGIDNGKQPLFNEDGTLALICNGEIYNYKELKKNLTAKGHRFNSDSDCEVILHLFEEKGIDCLSDLRGMFALLLWDAEQKKLIAARDQIGEKPLYFAEIPTGVVFSSELKAICKHVLPKTEPDFNIIRQYLEYTYPVDMRNTFIKQVKRLLPGEYAIVDKNGLKRRKYWRLSFAPTYTKSITQAKEDFLNLLRESIQLRFQSEVPVAIMLSGGIDSSAIACMAADLKMDIHAITVGYKGQPSCDEREKAKALAKCKQIQWHAIELDFNDFESYFEQYLKVVDEPVGDPVCVPHWGIYRKARELGFIVLLNGTGGDELFFGYPYHNITADQLQTIVELNRFLPLDQDKIKPFGEFFSKQFYRFSRNGRYLFLHPCDYFKPFKDCWKSIDFDWPDGLSYKDPNPLDRYLHEAGNGFDQLSAILFSTWLPGNSLNISDKLGLGNSVEIRAPFVDSRLVEFVFSLPVEWRFSAQNPKCFLKDALRGIVPDTILDAPKQGFNVPASFLQSISKRYPGRIFRQQEHNFHTLVLDRLFLQHFEIDRSITDSHTGFPPDSSAIRGYTDQREQALSIR